MPPRKTQKGVVRQSKNPNWCPLLHAVGPRVTQDFMWMFEAELEDGTRIHAYKHIDTRRYAHLDEAGVAYVYEDPDRYRAIQVATVFRAVFAGMGGLAGVTEQQLRASFDAVEWLWDLQEADTPDEV